MKTSRHFDKWYCKDLYIKFPCSQNIAANDYGEYNNNPLMTFETLDHIYIICHIVKTERAAMMNEQ